MRSPIFQSLPRIMDETITGRRLFELKIDVESRDSLDRYIDFSIQQFND